MEEMGLRQIKDPTAPPAGNYYRGPAQGHPGTGDSATPTLTTWDNATPWEPRRWPSHGLAHPWGWKRMAREVAKHTGEVHEPLP